MKEALDNARDELKRVDHLFYVSLKYTRTADMMRHMIERLINAFSFGVDSLLKYAKEKKKISSLPDNPAMKCSLLLRTFAGDDLRNQINLYLMLRKIIRCEYSKREEFRRHVTMIATIDKGEIVEVSIDTLKEYYDTTKNFINFVKKIIFEEKEES